MKEYTYYFVDGTKNTIQIEEKWYAILHEMDEQERKQKYNYERRNYPLSQVNYEGETFEDLNADPFEELIHKAEREKVNAAIATLTDNQRELFEMVFYENKKGVDIAAEQGVCHQAVSARLTRIKNKLQKFLA